MLEAGANVQAEPCGTPSVVLPYRPLLPTLNCLKIGKTDFPMNRKIQ